jgi:hypothetical protein
MLLFSRDSIILEFLQFQHLVPMNLVIGLSCPAGFGFEVRE